MIGSKEGARASSDVGGWGPERSRASQAESELGSIVSAPDIYPEDSGLIEELVVSCCTHPDGKHQNHLSEITKIVYHVCLCIMHIVFMRMLLWRCV